MFDSKGVTLVAFGNGSVDIFAAIAGMRQGRPDLVVGALLGGGAFVTLFVIGSIFALSKKFQLQGEAFIRDCIFYLIAIAWVFLCFILSNALRLWDALGTLFVCCRQTSNHRSTLKQKTFLFFFVFVFFTQQDSFCCTCFTCSSCCCPNTVAREAMPDRLVMDTDTGPLHRVRVQFRILVRTTGQRCKFIQFFFFFFPFLSFCF